MLVCCGEVVMDQLIVGGDCGGKSCRVRAVPFSLCAIVFAWFQLLQWYGGDDAVVVFESGGGCVTMGSASDWDVTEDKIVVRGLEGRCDVVVYTTRISG